MYVYHLNLVELIFLHAITAVQTHKSYIYHLELLKTNPHTKVKKIKNIKEIVLHLRKQRVSYNNVIHHYS